MSTTAHRDLSPSAKAWMASLDRYAEIAPPDRDQRVAAALAERSLPWSDEIRRTDHTLFGLRMGKQTFGVLEALEARRHLPAGDLSRSPADAPLVPLSAPHDYSPEFWMDATGAMYAVLFDLGVCSPTFDSVEHFLECAALQRIRLPARSDAFCFETNRYCGGAAAATLALDPLLEVEGVRCHAWCADRGIVIEAEIEQYLYGTFLGLHDAAAVADVLSALPDADRRALLFTKGVRPAPPGIEAMVERVFDVDQGQVWIYRENGGIAVAFRSLAELARRK